MAADLTVRCKIHLLTAPHRFHPSDTPARIRHLVGIAVETVYPKGRALGEIDESQTTDESRGAA